MTLDHRPTTGRQWLNCGLCMCPLLWCVRACERVCVYARVRRIIWNSPHRHGVWPMTYDRRSTHAHRLWYTPLSILTYFYTYKTWILYVCMSVQVFLSHQKSKLHEILPQGIIWANLKHDEARFFKCSFLRNLEGFFVFFKLLLLFFLFFFRKYLPFALDHDILTKRLFNFF